MLPTELFFQVQAPSHLEASAAIVHKDLTIAQVMGRPQSHLAF